MNFEYFRFLVTPLKQPDLPFDKRKSREQIIQDIFEADKIYEFEIGKTEYKFKIISCQDNKALGRIGKHTKRELHLPPEEDFQPEIHDDWPSNWIAINLSDERDSGKISEAGQVIAFQKNRSTISNPENCLNKLAECINKDIYHFGFNITINPIIKENKFWKIVNKNKGNIKRLTLSYTVPNLFNIENAITDDLKKANEVFGTNQVGITLENKTTSLKLSDENKFLYQSVNYINKGCGGFKIFLKNKIIIKSEDYIKTKNIKEIKKGNVILHYWKIIFTK